MPEIEVVESVTKTIGSLALVYPYLRRLQVAEELDALLTSGQGRLVPTGAVIEILILNRLAVRPTPISRLSTWAATQAIEEVYGIPAERLNDDRIGRALDEIHSHLADAWAALVLRGAEAYGVNLQQVHSDVTRVAFEGRYDQAATATSDGQPLAQICYGYSGKQDPSRKQVTVSLSVAADGAVPAWYQVADGNAADCRSYPAHLAALRERLHLDQPLIIGDSKLITRPNLLGFGRVRARFVGPTRATEADRQTLRGCWAAGMPMQRLDLPQPGAATVGDFWGLECAESLADPERQTSYALRRLFVHSRADRQAVRHQRAKDLAQAHRSLLTIRRRLPHPAYRQLAVVERKVAAAVAKVRPYLTAAVQRTDAGLRLHWHLEHARLREEASFDGVYCLLTNLSPSEATLVEVFTSYKGQSRVEGRFRVVKHPPLQVRPLWLHQPQRLESLIFVAMVALLLFALIERDARRSVAQTGQPFWGVQPEGRDHLPVTAQRLLDAFAPLTLVKQTLRVGSASVQIVNPTTLRPIQTQILQRLGLALPRDYLPATITPYPP